MKITLFLKKIICAIALMAISTTHGITRLIGISNRTPAHGGIPKPVVSIVGTEYQGIDLTDPMVGAKIQPFKNLKLPVTVTITYKDKTINEGKPYTIEIKELTAQEQELKGEKCGSGTKTIQAWLTQFNKNDAKTCCVTLAKNAFSKSGDSFEWQNVLLALANNPLYGTATGIKGLPFLFGIAPWTTTKAPWDGTLITNPDDEPDKPKQFTHVWETGPEKGRMGLKVMQGNPAWMGDKITLNMLPKKGCDNIVHIYNNSPYIINIIRDIREGTGGNFKKLLPPWSATPWVMAWIPTVSSTNFKPRDQVSAIKLCALYAPDPTCPEPLARIMPILRTAGSAEFSYNQGIPFKGDTKEMMDELKSLYTPDISDLLGESPLKDLMPGIDDTQYVVDDASFRIFTLDNQKGETYIQKCAYGESTATCTEYKKVAAPNTHPQFGYYKLIISKDPTKDGIKLDLSPAPYETVLEN